MNFYNKYILPKLLDASMKKEGLEKYRPEIAGRAEGVVLEIGFGSGLNLPYYKNITKLFALDPSLELYNLAKERISKVTFAVEYLQASAEKIPLGDGVIDTVVSTWSLCTIPQPEQALKEVLRVLKPGGKFMFIEHGKSPRQLTFNVQKALTPAWRHLSGNCHLDREIDKLIKEAGFEFQEIESFPGEEPLIYLYKGVGVVQV